MMADATFVHQYGIVRATMNRIQVKDYDNNTWFAKKRPLFISC